MFDVCAASTLQKASGLPHCRGERRAGEELSSQASSSLSSNRRSLCPMPFRLRYLFRGASSYTTQLKSALNGKTEGEEQDEQVCRHDARVNRVLVTVASPSEKNSTDRLQNLFQCASDDPRSVPLAAIVQIERRSLMETSREFSRLLNDVIRSLCCRRT